MVLSVLTVMEPAGDRTGNVNKGEDPTEDKAAEETPGTSTAGTPRRALRDRGAGRPRSGVTASVADVNGGTSSPQTSGRVLRDRSTRAVPAWLKDTKSSDDDEDEPSSDAGATKRRKVSNSRRKKNSDTAGSAEGYSLQGTEYVFVCFFVCFFNEYPYFNLATTFDYKEPALLAHCVGEVGSCQKHAFIVARPLSAVCMGRVE